MSFFDVNKSFFYYQNIYVHFIAHFYYTLYSVTNLFYFYNICNLNVTQYVVRVTHITRSTHSCYTHVTRCVATITSTTITQPKSHLTTMKTTPISSASSHYFSQITIILWNNFASFPPKTTTRATAYFRHHQHNQQYTHQPPQHSELSLLSPPLLITQSRRIANLIPWNELKIKKSYIYKSTPAYTWLHRHLTWPSDC